MTTRYVLSTTRQRRGNPIVGEEEYIFRTQKDAEDAFDLAFDPDYIVLEAVIFKQEIDEDGDLYSESVEHSFYLDDEYAY